MVVHFRPSSISTRTSTSVMVACSPGNSIRFPGQPVRPGIDPVALDERIRQLLHRGLSHVFTPSGSCRAIGSRIPDSTGVRHKNVYWPGAVSFISRYAGRASCADATDSGQHNNARNQIRNAQRSHSGPSPDGAGTCFFGGGGVCACAARLSGAAGSITEYLARMSA